MYDADVGILFFTRIITSLGHLCYVLNARVKEVGLWLAFLRSAQYGNPHD